MTEITINSFVDVVDPKSALTTAHDKAVRQFNPGPHDTVEVSYLSSGFRYVNNEWRFEYTATATLRE